MPRFDGDTLVHAWYDSSQEDEIGILIPNKDTRKPQPWVFVADTVDGQFRQYYYDRPTAKEVFTAFLGWQLS